jgi:5'-nucleotidase
MFAAVLALGGATQVAAAPPAGGPGEIVLTVLSTNDVHGAVDGVIDPALAGTARQMGGFDLLAGTIARLRATAPGPVLLVDGGDCFQGQAAVNLAKGSPCVRLFDVLGYDAATLGNHEFDYLGCGPDDAAHPPADPQCALKAAVAGSRHPIVVANVRVAASGERFAPPGIRPYAVVDAGGVKVGVTGVVTRTTPGVTSPGATDGLRFTDPAAAVRKVLPAMRAEGATVIVVLAHLGGACPNGADPPPGGRTAGCAVHAELGRLAGAFEPGEVDLIVAGHSHAWIAGDAGGVPITESMSQGRLVGRTRIRVDRATGRAVDHGVEVLAPAAVCAGEDPSSALCSRTYPGFVGVAAPDAAGAALRKELDDSVADLCRDVVFTATADLLHGRSAETPLGNLTADLMRAADSVEQGGTGGADFAFTNLGGIRDSLRAGPVTMCDLHRVWPFDDPLVEVTLTGGELAELFHALARGGHKGFAISGGTARHVEGELVVTDDAGRPLDPGRRYRVVTTTYLVSGGERPGSVLGRLSKDRFRTLRYATWRDAFRRILSARGTVAPPPLGRVAGP